MSNDDFPPPSPDGSETGLGDLASGSGDGARALGGRRRPHGTPPPPPSIDSTQTMPVTPSLPPN